MKSYTVSSEISDQEKTSKASLGATKARYVWQQILKTPHKGFTPSHGENMSKVQKGKPLC